MSEKPDEGGRSEAVSSPGENLTPAFGESPRRSFLPLVLVPLLIVSAFVVVIVLFGWLAATGTRPEDLVTRLQQGDRAGFQAAVELVQLLRDPANEDLRQDQQLARRLSTILQSELDAGSLDPERIQLRSFLCRALGELEGDETMPVLIQAANTERDLLEIEVRRSALESIAQIVQQRRERNLPLDQRLLPTVLEATRLPSDETPNSVPRGPLRATAAFTLGVIGSDPAQSRLVSLLEDPDADVRFNAATGLARHGRVEAEGVLLEMLDPEASSIVAAESTMRGKDWRREIVLRNALRSVESLLLNNRQMDARQLKEAIRRLAQESEDAVVRRRARGILQALDALPP